MKKTGFYIITMVVTLLSCFKLQAQIPESFLFQAEARDSRGKILVEEQLSVIVNILKGANEEEHYSEMHDVVMTNEYGLFDLQIGEGTPLLNDFSTISWGSDSYSLNIAVAIGSSDNYTDMGTTPLLSVPYALHSKSAESVPGLEIITNEERSKLSGIDDGAEVNVNADWNAVDGDAQILNKPFIPSAADGSETVLQSGSNISISGIGTSGDPYVVSASAVGDADLSSCEILLNFLVLTEDVANLYDAGVPLDDLISAGKSIYELLRHGLSINELIDAGASVLSLMQEGINTDELLAAGVPVLDIFNAGVMVGALENNGANELELIDAGLLGYLTDIRDGKSYKWVRIGDQIWMAENLAYNAPGSLVYNNDDANESTYGRLYTWDIAMNSESSSSNIPSGVQGTCPDGWHLPSGNEFNVLATFVDRDPREVLSSSWNGSGLSVLLAGGHSGADFYALGITSNFWSASDTGVDDSAYSLYLHPTISQITPNPISKSFSLSVRCIRD